MKRYSIPNQQAGFTIIEMLIAVLVISIGLLGMAGLQTTGIQQSHNSYLKTQASMLAYDMADRMRSNLQGVAAGAYDNVDSIDDPVNAAPGCASANTACSAADAATYDVYQWTHKNAEGSIASLLPSGYGMISQDGGVFTITVLWDEARTGATGKDCGTDPKVDLKCFRLEFIP
ncbi:MAG: type IV pilus modification protein PilV [Gammaproteobacteria bacterium]|nr:type IV pilus modification protein PilV [Gammaproteobacteria bacterium]